ncbi:hypothetical protein [Roseimaritima ulvae]|uniref:Uncharacterized protein n=1 Tax=Roseimaritima ulvae TaxID=980254 RepID=A0A5B9QMX0_9BACT|nr:hypothetical protein [Roseimaritima ulvae]QEG38825.1 hypothetical protein UC8_07830 [Roseimaritima ulvae]
MPAKRSLVIESLESRCLLAGITLITHGFNSNIDSWVAAMAEEIGARTDLALDQPLYRLTVTDPGHDGGPLQVAGGSRSGPDPTDAATQNPEIPKSQCCWIGPMWPDRCSVTLAAPTT